MATIFDPEIAVPTNRAKGLAARLHKRLPLIYGAGLTTVAARRWKCEINENAEMPVFWAELPELDHNELAGWTIVPKGVEVVVVALDDPLGDPRLARRMDATLDIIGSRVADVVRVSARGESPLARVLSSAYIGDAVSFYLAIMNGVDPAPVSAIERLKASLADDPAGE
jgi:glucose/mannose-6-phosphate isomerase